MPRDVSVVGFDDTFDAFTHGLSSYDFNGRAAVNAMVNYVLRPARSRGDEALTVDGHLVARHSLGQAAAGYGG